jgi:hypothetical protein
LEKKGKYIKIYQDKNSTKVNNSEEVLTKKPIKIIKFIENIQIT